MTGYGGAVNDKLRRLSLDQTIRSRVEALREIAGSMVDEERDP